MGTSIAQFSGLASGVQWRDLVDQLVEVEGQRNVAPITSAIDLEGRRRTAWTRFRDLVSAFGTASTNLRAINGFSANRTSVPTSASTNRALVGLTAGASAQPGTYAIEVKSLASSEKLAGGVVSATDTALGYSGSFTINGRTVTLQATDTLATVRDRINALNSGSTPSRVAASILTTGAGRNRLVLTSETTGASGISIGGDTAGIAADLGFGTQQTKRVSSATLALAAAMGISVPPPASIEVNGRIITVDLTNDSLQAIAARIQAAGGEASVESEPAGSGSMFRLSVGGSVQAIDGDADSADALAALGFESGPLRAVRQQVATAQAFTAGGSAASGSSALTSLSYNGTPLALATGDSINVTGTRGDGSTFTVGITLSGGETLDTLLTRMNSSVDGFGRTGTRTAAASLGTDGKLRVIDGTGGDSRAAFSLQVIRADGTTTDLGASATEVAGRSRVLAAGSDARVVIDGTEVTRASNNFSDAVPGVSFSLLQAEPGTTINATITRDVDAQVNAVKAFAKAYNDIAQFVNQQRTAGQPLAGNASLRSALASLTAGLRTASSTSGSYTQLAVAGVALDREGSVQVNDTQLREALTDGTNGSTLMDTVGTALKSTADLLTRIGDGPVSVQLSSIDGRVTRLTQRQTVAQDRVEELRKRYIQQFTDMERVVSQLQRQSTSLTSSLSALRGSNR
jgi:flagellar hook-associated protein 2